MGFRIRLAILAALSLSTSIVSAQGNSSTPGTPVSRKVGRVFFQDDDSKTLKWSDLTLSDKLQFGTVSVVEGFPSLDKDRQTLVQMEVAKGMIMIGVRDDDEGEFQSGWILISTGVDQEEHGDHSHWHYVSHPRVRAMKLDKKQGNPAHLYCYDDIFYMANDKANGFTRLAVSEIAEKDDASKIAAKATFHAGGGGHITMAAVQKRLAFSSWIDRQGDNMGRVDVTMLQPKGNPKILGSFHLPSGGIHGATQNSGRVFFAPSDGICWVDAPSSSSFSPSQIKVNHISLGKVDDKPIRTGAFTNFGRHVAFTTGAGKDAALCIVDAMQKTLTVSKVAVPMADGNRPAGLVFSKTRQKSILGFLFHDHPADVEAPNRLTLLQMDPNGDGNWKDATVDKELEVGKAKLEGHGGHHSLDVDGDLRRAVFSNSGDGTLSVLSLEDKSEVAKFTVGGSPSKVIVVGGRGN